MLVADESDQVRAVITDNLTADGYCVRRADSRAGALAILTEDRVDAVVVDVNGDTLGLIDAIRCGSDRVGSLDRDVPVIALTAKASDAVHRIRLLDRGADDVLDKPFSYPELCAPGSPRSCAGPSGARHRRPRCWRAGCCRSIQPPGPSGSTASSSS